MLIDSHCHLDMFPAAEREAVVARATAAGVGEMVSISTRLGQARSLIDMASKLPAVWCTVGVHPHNAHEEKVPAPETLAAMTRHKKVVGIGESGLDYFYDKAPRPVQQASFRAHIRAARLAELPLVIHARDADDDIASILQEEWDQGGPYPFLLHCFSSGAGLAEAGLALGGYVSFSGILTFPKSTALREIAKSVPAERLLVETDAPVPGADPVPGQAQRARLRRADCVRAGRGARVGARGAGRADHRQFPAPVRQSGRLMPRVVMLGCGGSAGVPQIGGADGFGDWGACDPAEPRNRRTRSSIVIEGPGGRLLVDTSPDMRAQLLACGVPGVDAILFTHAHADHVLGLDDVRILNRVAGRPLDAYATERTLHELEQRFEYAFKPWQPPHFFRPVLVPNAVRFDGSIDVVGLRLRLFEQDHGFQPTLGFRAGGFAYSTDVVQLGEDALSILEGVDTWVVDCFQRQPHKTHANLEQVVAWCRRVKPRRVVLTHMGYDIDWEWLQRRLPPGFEPGHDGLVLELPEDGLSS